MWCPVQQTRRNINLHTAILTIVKPAKPLILSLGGAGEANQTLSKFVPKYVVIQTNYSTKINLSI